MTLRTCFLLGAMMIAGATALAHADVQNPEVAARMQAMKDIAKASRTLGNMAKGEAAFSAEAAAAARQSLIDQAEQVPALFAEPATDPESEASPEIWSDWPTFEARSTDLLEAAMALDTDSLDSIRAGMGPIGRSCGGCHETFRIDD